MNNYELTIVLAGKATPAKRKAVEKSVEEIVKTHEGKIAKHEDWGKKELAYQIDKNETGIFSHYLLELEPKAAKSISALINRVDDVIRFLLIRAK